VMFVVCGLAVCVLACVFVCLLICLFVGWFVCWLVVACVVVVVVVVVAVVMGDGKTGKPTPYRLTQGTRAAIRNIVDALAHAICVPTRFACAGPNCLHDAWCQGAGPRRS